MPKLLFLSILQAFFLCAGQVLLKIAVQALPPFSFTWAYMGKALTNWWFPACGASFTAAGLLWMYILRHYTFSLAYPLSSLAYVFGMIASLLVFQEQVSVSQWVGILLIMAGCYFIAN